MSLLARLGSETELFASDQSLLDCLAESQNLLSNLKAVQSGLQEDGVPNNVENHHFKSLEVNINDWSKKVLKSEKSCHSMINKYSKSLSTHDSVDLDKSYLFPLHPERDNNQIKLIKAIIIHLFRTGSMDVIDSLLSSYGLSINEEYVNFFKTLNVILDDLNNKKSLESAIEWATINSAKLSEIQSNLEFNLHKLKFVMLYNSKNVDESGTPVDGSFIAYKYANANFKKFGSTHLSVISKLITSIVFKNNNFDASERNPYSSLVNLDSQLQLNFKNISIQFAQNYCELIGLSTDSTIFQSLLAGFYELPNFIKFSKIKAKLNLQVPIKDNPRGYELPFQTNLPNWLQFHSVFICPVSKEQVTESNPAMSLPCNHILSKESVMKLSRNGSNGAIFKCPYCPTNCQVNQIKECYFIDL